MSNLHPDQSYQAYRPRSDTSHSRHSSQNDPSAEAALLRDPNGHYLMPTPSNVNLFASRSRSASSASRTTDGSFEVRDGASFLTRVPYAAPFRPEEEQQRIVAHSRSRASSYGAMPPINAITRHAIRQRHGSTASRRHDPPHLQIDRENYSIPTSTLTPPLAHRGGKEETLYTIGSDTLSSLVRNCDPSRAEIHAGCEMPIKMAILVCSDRVRDRVGFGNIDAAELFVARHLLIGEALVYLESPEPKWPLLKGMSPPAPLEIGQDRYLSIVWPGYQALQVFWRLEEIHAIRPIDLDKFQAQLFQLYFLHDVNFDWSEKTWTMIRTDPSTKPLYRQAAGYLLSITEDEADEMIREVETWVRKKILEQLNPMDPGVEMDEKLPEHLIFVRIKGVWANLHNAIARVRTSRSRPGAGSNDPDSPSWDVPTLASASRASSPLVQPEVGRLRRRMTQMTTLPSRIHRRATTLRRRPSPNPPRSTSPTARIGRIGGEDRHGNAVYDDSPFAVGDRKGKRAMIKKFFRPHGSE